MNDNSNFSDIPSLDDVQGLQDYLSNESLKAQGLEPTSQEANTEAAATGGETKTKPFSDLDVNNLTVQDLAVLQNKVNEVRQKMGLNNPQPARPVVQPQQAVQPQQSAYSDAEKRFITEALNRGYDINSINKVILEKRNGGVNSVLNNRLNNIEQYLRTQEYAQAQNAFIDKLSTFGEKWGLSEQDLVSFGQMALNNGINIAVPTVNLETVFRAIYPDQYAIRLQRMQSTNSSQIYGGISIPENPSVASEKQADAYVDAFLKKNMSGYF